MYSSRLGQGKPEASAVALARLALVDQLLVQKIALRLPRVLFGTLPCPLHLGVVDSVLCSRGHNALGSACGTAVAVGQISERILRSVLLLRLETLLVSRIPGHRAKDPWGRSWAGVGGGRVPRASKILVSCPWREALKLHIDGPVIDTGSHLLAAGLPAPPRCLRVKGWICFTIHSKIRKYAVR